MHLRGLAVSAASAVPYRRAAHAPLATCLAADTALVSRWVGGVLGTAAMALVLMMWLTSQGTARPAEQQGPPGMEQSHT